MTDNQRFSTLGCAGNAIIQTPKLRWPRIGGLRGGSRFTPLLPANCRLVGGRLKLADFGLPATNDMGSSVYSSPVVADDVLYISTRDHLFAIGAK